MNGTSKSTIPLGPVEESRRIQSVDVLRGVAVLGILLLNIVGMALPDPAYRDPTGYGGDKGWNLWFFAVNSMLFEGTMRGLFSMLFGAGVILFTSWKEQDGAGTEMAKAWYRRTTWLMVFGLVHAYLLVWPGEILFQYGFVGLFLFPLRKLKAGTLIAASIFVFMVTAALNMNEANNVEHLQAQANKSGQILASGQDLTRDQKAALEKWAEKEAQYKPSGEHKEQVIRKMRSGYLSAVKTMAPVSLFMQTTFFIRHFFLDVLSMMLLGMGLFKLGIFHAGNRVWVYLAMVILGYGAGLIVNWHETRSYLSSGYSVVSYFRNQRTYDLGRICMMMGHVGSVMLFMKLRILAFLKRTLAATGRMALSNYIMQTVVATIVFVIFKQYGQWQRYQLYYLVFGIWVFQLVLSPFWLHYFRFGPLEWIWRWLTYKRKPPFKKGS